MQNPEKCKTARYLANLSNYIAKFGIAECVIMPCPNALFRLGISVERRRGGGLMQFRPNYFCHLFVPSSPPVTNVWNDLSLKLAVCQFWQRCSTALEGLFVCVRLSWCRLRLAGPISQATRHLERWVCFLVAVHFGKFICRKQSLLSLRLTRIDLIVTCRLTSLSSSRLLLIFWNDANAPYAFPNTEQEAKGIWQRLHRVTSHSPHVAYTARAATDLSRVRDRLTDRRREHR